MSEAVDNQKAAAGRPDRELRILILEDVASDAELAERALRRAGLDFVARRAATREAFLEALDSFAPGIILADYRLPGFDGLTAVRLARERCPEVPVIMVTGALGDEAATEVVRAGAADYVLKDHLAHLPIAVRRSLAEAEQIRARKAAEQALRVSERRFRTLLEGASDWIWEIDAQGRYTYSSPRVATLLGYTSEEVVGRSPFELMAPAEAGQVSLILKPIIASRMPARLVEATFRKKDGREVALETSLSPVVGEDGSFRGYRGISRDITERKAAEARIVALAMTDALTGLANRAAFIERLEQTMRAAHRRGSELAVLYLDLDNFKDINDEFGHAVGDGVLHTIAERLAANLRKTDLVARFGGDEFAILLPEIENADDAGTLAAKVCGWLAAPFTLDGAEVRLSTSIGISLGRAGLANAEDMLRQADLALYRAKHEGRDRYCFHSPDLDDRVRERLILIEDLHAAIAGDQFELHYQPEIAEPGGHVVGLEALIRWNHPKRGQLPPAAFIPAAERTEVISAIGRWVLDRACRQISLWRHTGITPPRVAVNFSARQLPVPRQFERDLAASLAQWDIEPGMIELEIAEAALGPDGRGRMELAGLRSLGLGLAVDDFGTGYSSLEELKTQRFARLKIAPKFVAASIAEGGAAAIVRAAVALAQALDIGVVAKGVETKAQLDLVRAAGCERVQGYYLSPPVTAERTTELLRRGRISPVSGNRRVGRSAGRSLPPAAALS